jgi:hypothetical protein
MLHLGKQASLSSQEEFQEVEFVKILPLKEPLWDL